MLKITLLICIPIFLFVSLERVNISLWIASELQNMRYYIGTDDTIRNYNEAVLLLHKSDYSAAKSLLQPILNNKNLKNPEDIYELYGDLVYEARGSTGDVAVFYNRSLEHRDSLRVKKKLEILSTLSPSSQEPIDENTTAIDTPKDMTGALEREKRRQEISHPDNQKQTIRDLSAGMVEPQDLITRTLDLLSTGSSIPKDW
jgi:hypothetical protein